MHIQKLQREYREILNKYIKGEITEVGFISFLMNVTNPYMGYEEEKYIDKYNIIGDLFSLYEHFYYKSTVLKLKNPQKIIDRLLKNIEIFINET